MSERRRGVRQRRQARDRLDKEDSIKKKGVLPNYLTLTATFGKGIIKHVATQAFTLTVTA